MRRWRLWLALNVIAGALLLAAFVGYVECRVLCYGEWIGG